MLSGEEKEHAEILRHATRGRPKTQQWRDIALENQTHSLPQIQSTSIGI